MSDQTKLPGRDRHPPNGDRPTGAVAGHAAPGADPSADPLADPLADFTNLAAHELQQPLRKIEAFAGVLAEALATGNIEEAGRAARIIEASARRASALVRDLLALSRANSDPARRERIAFASLVRATIADVLAGTPPGELPEIIDAMEEVSVDADPVQAELLVRNLVGNALRYRHPARPAVIRIRLARDDRVFEVEDNGIGFDPESAATIFEPFRRLDASLNAGTGLGLSLCAAVCARHGWAIEALGQPGLGALFRVRLGEDANPSRQAP